MTEIPANDAFLLRPPEIHMAPVSYRRPGLPRGEDGQVHVAVDVEPVVTLKDLLTWLDENADRPVDVLIAAFTHEESP